MFRILLKRLIKARAKADKGGGVNLRDARFTDAHDQTYFFHGELLEIVQSDDLALLAIEFLNGLGQERAHFRTKRDAEGIFLGTDGDAGDLLVAGGVVGLRVQAAEIEAAKISEEALKFREL